MGPDDAKIVWAALSINGETVVERTYDPPVKITDVHTCKFDSSHIGDGSDVLVMFIATDTLGYTGVTVNSAPAYNKAFLFGNQVAPNGIGDLNWGQYAVQDVAARLAGTNHTVNPAAGTRCYQVRNNNITSALPINTVFYGWTHGKDGAFGDSTSVQGDMAGSAHYIAHWLTYGQVHSILVDPITGKGAIGAPPYSFVFLNSCKCGMSEGLANGFGIENDPTDRAFLGWNEDMADSEHNVNWTHRLFLKRAAGWTIDDSIVYANDPDGEPVTEDHALTSFGMPTSPHRYGDLYYKLHMVYLGDPSQWHR